MSENGSTGDTTGDTTGGSGDVPDAVVERSRGFSPIWLIPIVVAIVAGSLAYRAIQEQGEKVVLLFESAEGLEAGKSTIKYRDVEIGTVDLIQFRDVSQVEVHVSISKRAAKAAVEDTLWWVVRPRFGGGGISGLSTIVSGAYVTIQPGKPGGKKKREFLGLEEPPIPERDLPGIQLVLHSDQLGGVEAGSSIFFRNLDVGDVLQHSLGEDGKMVEIKIVIREKYAPLVKSTSSFWNAGGVDVKVGASGLEVKTESLQSILTGGVAFDSPAVGATAKAGDAFWLHGSQSDVEKTRLTHGGLGLVLETGALGGVALGNPVYYREVPVGSVVSHELSKDGSQVRIKVNVDRQYASLVRHNSVFWNASGISADLGLTGLHVHAESLKSLLTGGVAFATPPKPGHTVSEGSVFRLHPEAKKKWLEWQTDFEPSQGDPPEKHSAIGRFFHHEKKTEKEAKKDDPTPEPSEDEHKHGFLHKLFHRGG
jgi:paraquat-inducible protein B